MSNRYLTRPSDDKIEESHLSSAFDITCRAWEVRGELPILTVVLTFKIATIRCPLHVLWLSAAGQLLSHPPRTVLMCETGGHHRPETKPAFGLILHSEEILNQPNQPTRS